MIFSKFPSLRFHVPETVEFDSAVPFTEINGYKFHTEIYGQPESAPVVVVHGGPGQGFHYLTTLKKLSIQYRVIFYDQRGAGLSPRVDQQQLTIEQNLKDLEGIVRHFSGGEKVKLIAHSWGGQLVIGLLSRHPELISQAVVVEPLFLYPGEPVIEWVKIFRRWNSFWKIAPFLFYYPFVKKQDGHEANDFIATKIANQKSAGPPYNCKAERLPSNAFIRLGYSAHKYILQPIIDHPESFTLDLTRSIYHYQGDLLLISSECSFFGSTYQEKYHLPKLPAQTRHLKAEDMGHNLLTLNAEWSLKIMENFFTA